MCDVRTGDDWMMYPELRALVRKLGIRPIPELRRGWTCGHKNDGISKAKRGVTSFLHPNKAIGVLARVNAGKDPDTEWSLRWKLRTDDFPDVKVLGSLKRSVANYEDQARILSGMWSGDDLQMIPRELMELTIQSRELRRIYNRDRQSVEGDMASLMPASRELINQLVATRSAFAVVEKYSTILMKVAEKIQSEIEEESEDASIPSRKTIAEIITESIAEAMPELLDEVLRHSGVRRYPDQLGKITDFVQTSE